MADRTGVWLYAVTRSRDRRDELTGVAGAPVRPIESAGLVALGSTVDLASYGEEALKRNLEDLDWLAATARAHDHVVRAATSRGPSVPLRLATVYLDDDRVRAMLDTRGADFAAALRRFDGRAEWGVKGYAEPAATPEVARTSASSGTDYLRRRRAELADRRASGERAAEDAAGIHEALSAFAVAARTHPPQAPALSGASVPMVLNATYLVADGHAAEFGRLVTEQDERRPGIRLELTGPWPPYSFANDDIAEVGRP